MSPDASLSPTSSNILLNQLRLYASALSAEFAYLYRRLTRPAIVDLDGVRLDTRQAGITKQLRNRIYRNGYEWQERRIIAANLSQDDVVLEIGAGMGLISTLCAKRIGGERVHCFEANPALEPIIRQAHALNGVARHLAIACVGREEGEKTFYVEEQLVSSSPIRRSGAARAISIRQLDFQRLLDSIRPSFLVVDVEGYEAELFADVRLAGVAKMCIELHPHVIGAQATSRVIRNILNQGYTLDVDMSEGRVAFFSAEPPLAGNSGAGT